MSDPRNAEQAAGQTELEDQVYAILQQLDRLKCVRCRATPPNSVPEPCRDCVTGHMRARITELEGAFHYDFLTMRSRGRCGHVWNGQGECPFCELVEKGRPKGLVKRVAEQARW